MKVFLGGSWREVTTRRAYVGGAWRRVTRRMAYIGGAWRTVATFLTPLSSSTSVSMVFGDGGGFTVTTVLSDTVTVTPSGGLGPYTYAWSKTGAAALSSTNSATVYVSQALSKSASSSGTLSYTVTDSLGATASGSVGYLLTNGDGL
jgi:hypothetical protein